MVCEAGHSWGCPSTAALNPVAAPASLCCAAFLESLWGRREPHPLPQFLLGAAWTCRRWGLILWSLRTPLPLAAAFLQTFRAAGLCLLPLLLREITSVAVLPAARSGALCIPSSRLDLELLPLLRRALDESPDL